MMNEGIKQRLVGALVLLALGTVLLPMLFDFDGAYNVDTRTSIPASPDIQAVVIKSTGRVKGISPGASPQEMFNFDKSRKKVQQKTGNESWLKDQAPGLNAEGIPLAWVVQVASFVDPAKAQILTEQLIADDYKAYNRRVVIEGVVNYRVYVGPKVLKKVMLEEKRAIEKKYKLQTLLLVFEP